MLVESLGVEHLELQAQEHQVEDHEVQAARTRAQQTGAVGLGLQGAVRRRHPLGRLLQRVMEADGGPLRVRARGDAARDERRQVLGGRRTGLAARTVRGPRRDTVHAERTPVGAVQVPGDEVPAALGAHKPVRLHDAAALAAAVVPVVEAQPLRVPADGGEFGQHGGVDGGLAARGVQHRHGERVQRADTAAQPAGQHLFELAESPHRTLPDALDALPGGGPEPHRHGHRLVVVKQQRRQLGPRPQLIAPARARTGVHGIPELAKPIDVPPHRTRRDPEPLREITTGPLPMGLQQGQQLEQPSGGLQHAPDSPPARGQQRSAMPARECPHAPAGGESARPAFEDEARRAEKGGEGAQPP
ncbi:hypothetical protein GCM10012286_75750 [Streptomyces lasiicapitis]|uniref:Uncharacterized protein n=1 Tax=Streptomyces lasiicapitis TaxID=1923961 RepID=A0ABQ2MT90_9ACTN|nr:hypothetical protein GCM10012286_75750 [Streptomyces lasiicapitis]